VVPMSDTPGRRRREVAAAGHLGDRGTARAHLADPDPGVRAIAVGALARSGALTVEDLAVALADPDSGVRRRACEVAAAAGAGLGGDIGSALLERLGDEDDRVVETAAWALGEVEPPAGAVTALAELATAHAEPLVREAAVAALGAIGDPAGLPAILAATGDKPAVRRRAVLALAPFEGPEVDAALQRALADRDWQVRDAAELLLR
jgi:HEAT repeat protein